MSTPAAAARVFRLWHKRDPDEAIVGKENFPSEMQEIGRALEILYRSNKWTRKYCDYIHECDSHAPVYAGGRRGGIATPKLLGVPNFFTAQTGWADLAKMVELTYEDNEGEPRVVTFKNALLCTHDRKTLVVVRDRGGPIVIKGAKMHITAHGIER